MSDNSVYGYGDNFYFQISSVSGDKDRPTLETRTSALTGVPMQIATGQFFSALLTPTGDLYSVGRGRNGGLGLGDSNDPYPDYTTYQQIGLNLGAPTTVDLEITPTNSMVVQISNFNLVWNTYELSGSDFAAL